MLDVFLLPELRREEQQSGLLVRGGGSAANTAAWMASTGSEATFVGCVGNDAIGAALTEELRGSGVQTAVRSVAGAETGCVAVEVREDAERVMRSARGANVHLAPEDIVYSVSTAPDLVHLTGYALLSPSGLELLEAASSVARSCGARLSFDPSSAGVINHVGPERLMDELQRAGVSVFLPNKLEALCCCNTDDFQVAVQTLGAIFPTVLIKTGATGAVAVAEGVAVPAPVQPMPRVDSTGAGDAFNAGALLSLLRGNQPREAAHAGHRVAARAIMRYGGRPTPATDR